MLPEMIHADIVKWAAEYEGEPYHAILCDPPYHLTEITKRFGKPNSAPAQHGSDGAFARASRGFLGRSWDGGDIAFRPETWDALACHLYPGAFGMAFASARGVHRMAVAIEDAGLIIHPLLACWAYASGFPKATNPADQYVGTRLREWLQQHPDAAAELRAAKLAVRQAPKGHTAEARAAYQKTKQRLQEAAGLTRVVGQKKHAPKFDAASFGYREKDNGFNSKDLETFDVVEYLDPVAAAWAGHRYGLQALKPAVEPIIVFQKPYGNRAIDDIISTGAGAFNIDAGRIGSEIIVTEGGSRADDENWRLSERVGQPHTGRWPANLVLVHHPLCADDQCYADCAVLHMSQQSGERASGGRVRGNEPSAPATNVYNNTYGRVAHEPYEDSGSAARFYYCADWVLDRIEASDPVGFYAKPTAGEREAGLDPFQAKLMRDLYGDEDGEDFELEFVDDGRETSIDNPYQRGETERRNTHPTIKPLNLTRWLSQLLLPPPEYGPRRLLVPFAGTGSEMAGAMLAGWEHITGVELEADHVPIAQARLRYWHQRRTEFNRGQPIKVRQRRQKKGVPASVDMFEEAA